MGAVMAGSAPSSRWRRPPARAAESDRARRRIGPAAAGSYSQPRERVVACGAPGARLPLHPFTRGIVGRAIRRGRVAHMPSCRVHVGRHVQRVAGAARHAREE